VNGLELSIEMITNRRKTNSNLLGLRHAESREGLMETEVSGLHNCEIDYTARARRAVPSREKRLRGAMIERTNGRYAFLAWGGAAALALATKLEKAAASFTAMSARILRSSETPAALRPCINWP
jgi:hypothetical protein